MTVQQVTIELPEAIFRQLLRIAQATHQPVEALVAQSVISNLPPSPDNAPPEWQSELLSLQNLSNKDLLEVAHAQTEQNQSDRHVELLEKNGEGLLTPQEQQELIHLRQSADRLMIRKTYAWSILRWRGYRVPSLKALPVLP